MRKMIAFALSMVLILSLAACGGKSGSGSASKSEVYTNTPVDISGQEDEFTKKLVPLDYGPGEEVESPYYKSVAEDGKVYYIIQPEGEEPMKVPVSESVIYVVGTPAECQITKTVFDYTPEGGETTHIEQYRIFAATNGSDIMVTGDDGGSTSEDQTQPEPGEQDPAEEGSPVPEG